MVDDRELWACALKVLDTHGVNAPQFVASRIGALALEGDQAGIEAWKAIAEKMDQIRAAQESAQ